MEKAKILVVDDKPENLLALQGVLRGDDRDILTATSGRSALELLIAHEFALVLIDVQMPDMSGFELAEMMRGSDDTRAIPIIFVTAGAADNSITFEGFDLGAVDFLYKPLSERIVRSKVNVFLELYRQRRLLQQQVLQLERFASIASHDMREPLRMISSYVTLLERKYGTTLDDEGKEFIRYAVSGAKRLATLVESLIQHARVTHGELEITKADCKGVLEEVLQDLSVLISEKKAEVTYSNLPILGCDRPQLRQLFQNLITNAIKFTQDRPPRVHVDCAEEESSFTFRVEDNGIGIAPTLTSKIFDPFFRAHQRDRFGGNGLGLSVCKSIVERHHGKIWVESNGTDGSTFCFQVPKQPAHESARSHVT